MQQLSGNIIVLTPGELCPPGCEDAIKLVLLGSIDTRPDQKFDWAGKFCNGLVELTDPLKGVLQYRGVRFVVYNTTTPPANLQAPPTVDNPEFVSKLNWMFQCLAECDLIFCNFLARSKEMMPMYWLAFCSQSQKMVVRCPDQYCNYGTVQVTCQNFNIPLMPGKVGSVMAIVQAMNSISDVFNLKKDKNILPE